MVKCLPVEAISCSLFQKQDAKLIDAVEKMGTCWTTIVKSYFSGRTALAAKNRWDSLSLLLPCGC
jgi:hypothetical protein